MDDDARSLDEMIRKAIERGEFDGLRGKGKPLQMDDNPLADPDWRLAHHLLKSNDFTLGWIADQKEIDEQLASARSRLANAWRYRKNTVERYDVAEANWQRAMETFREGIAALNRKIRDYNLSVPLEQFQKLTINAEREIENIQTE
jgi:DnaJ homolog subfamily C member 28